MLRTRERRDGAGLERLRHDEGVRLDPDRLLALYAELGDAAAENVICRAIEELAVRLSDVQRFAQAGDRTALIRAASLLSKVAAQVGMTTLSKVVLDVRDCAKARDTAGLGATLARLVRVGDRSLTAVWDMQDVTV